MEPERTHYDVVIVGSGFGGALAAWPLVRAGLDVLMLERGPRVERGPHNWEPEGTLTRTRYFSDEQLRVRDGDGERREGVAACVGGPSVFYGGVSTRFRREDFEPHGEIVGDTGARWPLSYEDLRPRYAEAERILGVAGREDGDPTAPPRRVDYPQAVNGLSPTARMIAGAARRLGHRPYHLPLAINYGLSRLRPTCVECDTCDTFACAVGAKNDLATRVLPRLLQQGLDLRPETAVLRLESDGGAARAAVCRDLSNGESLRFTAEAFVLAGGALGTPQILLASNLDRENPAGDAVGRYLTRHCAAIVFGCYRSLPDEGTTFHKQVGVNDFYLGDPDGDAPPGKLGNIQQTQSPSPGTVRSELPRPLPRLLAPALRRATGLLVLAEDQPRPENRLELDPAGRDPFGLPRPAVHHQHTERDRAARAALVRRARQIHEEAGALFTYVHPIHTFSHALGTVRMGPDPDADPVAADGRYRGLENLRVADGSVFPTPAGVNPSLTIAANALRVGRRLARDDFGVDERERAAGGDGSGPSRRTTDAGGADPATEAPRGRDAAAERREGRDAGEGRPQAAPEPDAAATRPANTAPDRPS